MPSLVSQVKLNRLNIHSCCSVTLSNLTVCRHSEDAYILKHIAMISFLITYSN